ncbi:MAG: exodeoxyribonuclease VII large subunit [Clostridia bacterium]|nr:exodeoxyribonuclease VII large subunit [Clostridia bacterium]
MNLTDAKVLSVEQLNLYVKMKMDQDPLLQNVYVRGEISNFKNHYQTGHLYFSLKDSGGVLGAVMFRTYAEKLVFRPGEGMKVIVRGRVSAYPKSGQYQIYVSEMIPDGIGSLYLAFQQLKEKLQAEGLFDESHKLPLPRFPRRIGIITAPTGAALQDMKNIIGRRYPACTMVLYPSLVQGAEAPAQLREGIRYFASGKDPVDVIIIGRGGGSLEDLWAFNDEGLTREIYACPVPVVSAVGHEVDFTLCDFVADLRASTPSAAAELVVPDRRQLAMDLAQRAERIRALFMRSLQNRKSRLELLSKTAVLRSSRGMLDVKKMNLLTLEDRLFRLVESRLKQKRQKLDFLGRQLEALSPRQVLNRGYALVVDKGRHARTGISEIAPGDKLELLFRDGEAGITVDTVSPFQGREDTDGTD